MVILAIVALVGGILVGLSSVDMSMLSFFTSRTDWILYLLMFSVGISVGQHKGILQQIRRYHIKIFIIPFGIIVGSLLGGVICAPLTGYSLSQSTMVASGLGWYSLSGVTITTLAGAELGSIAFLSNLMREIFSFFLIPWISRHLNYYTCIAPAAATSEDTTLSMMVRFTDEETVVLSVFNGMVCSAFVPLLIAFCNAVFS